MAGAATSNQEGSTGDVTALKGTVQRDFQPLGFYKIEPYWAPESRVETFLQSCSIPPRYENFFKSDRSVTHRGVSLASV